MPPGEPGIQRQSKELETRALHHAHLWDTQIEDDLHAGRLDAQQRLEVLATMELLAVTEEALTLAQAFIAAGPMPAKATEDAIHIALAVTSGIEYLLTWNCRHLANATMRCTLRAIAMSCSNLPWRDSVYRQHDIFAVVGGDVPRRWIRASPELHTSTTQLIREQP